MPEDMRNPPPLDDILTLVDAARLSGISAHTFAQQAEKGKLQARKVGHTWITTRHWLNVYLALHARRKKPPEMGATEQGVVLRTPAPRLVDSVEPTNEGTNLEEEGTTESDRNPAPPLKIVVPTDGSREATEACWSAIELARRVGARLTIIHVAQPHLLRSSFDGPSAWRDAEVAARKAGEQILNDARALCGPNVRCTTEVLFGNPAPTICRRARELDADLIVIGSRGLGTIKRLLLGSVSAAVSNRAPCSVLVVRGRSSLRS